jgi:phage terminase large subunit-like protein
MPDGTQRVWQRSYVPQTQVQQAIQTRRVPYDHWIQQGWLIATPGNVTDYEFIIADLLGDAWQQGQINEKGILYALPSLNALGIDRWNAGWIANKLLEFGLPVMGYGMGYQSMSPAMKALEHDYLGGTLQHNGDELLTWAMHNVVVTLDPALNIKPDKKQSTEKIDPAVALIIAKGMSLAKAEPQPESAYAQDVWI